MATDPETKAFLYLFRWMIAAPSGAKAPRESRRVGSRVFMPATLGGSVVGASALRVRRLAWQEVSLG